MAAVREYGIFLSFHFLVCPPTFAISGLCVGFLPLAKNYKGFVGLSCVCVSCGHDQGFVVSCWVGCFSWDSLAGGDLGVGSPAGCCDVLVSFDAFDLDLTSCSLFKLCLMAVPWPLDRMIADCFLWERFALHVCLSLLYIVTCMYGSSPLGEYQL